MVKYLLNPAFRNGLIDKVNVPKDVSGGFMCQQYYLLNVHLPQMIAIDI